MTTLSPPDPNGADGCGPACRIAGIHTRGPGICVYAAAPDFAVRVRAFADKLAASEYGFDLEADSIRRTVAAELHAILDGAGPAASAVVPPVPADRAALLREAADHLEARAAEFTAAARKDPLAFVKGATDARYRTADCWDAAADELRRMADEAQQALPSIHANDVQGFCPTCGHPTLYVGEGGHLTCSLMDCPKPEAADELLCRVTDEAQQSCPGYETTPNRCTCDCEGCKHDCAAHQADEAQQPETQADEAHPAEHTWAAELHDPLADEWVPGTRYLARDRAVNALAHARRIGPTWKDGTPTQRRLVRATTTYTVEAEHTPVEERTP